MQFLEQHAALYLQGPIMMQRGKSSGPGRTAPVARAVSVMTKTAIVLRGFMLGDTGGQRAVGKGRCRFYTFALCKCVAAIRGRAQYYRQKASNEGTACLRDWVSKRDYYIYDS
jgi:hypothetical protein